MTWHKGGEEIDDEDIVSKLDYTTSKLLIKKASLSDGGTYTCMFESEDGHKVDAQSVIYVYGKSLHTHDKLDLVAFSAFNFIQIEYFSLPVTCFLRGSVIPWHHHLP